VKPLTDHDVSDKTGVFMPSDIQKLTALYPNVPALGSPYNTGNDSAAFPPTLGAQFKRAASYVGKSRASATS